MSFRDYPLLLFAMGVFLNPTSIFATEPQRLYERYTMICSEITALRKAPEYEFGHHTVRRAMERRIIESAFNVPEVRQTFQAVAQADPRKKMRAAAGLYRAPDPKVVGLPGIAAG